MSAIPPKVLGGRASSFCILSHRDEGRYLELTGRYRYESGIEVTALCYLLFLCPEPLASRSVDPSLAAYNGVELPRREGKREFLSYRWNVERGSRIVFYVDRAFPQEWYPYIKEGVEDWNGAFRRIGLGDVLEVLPEPADSTFDRYSPLVNMVRFIDSDESNAKGDVLADPRSGEILQADILWWKDVLGLLCDWRYVQTGAADPAARLSEYPMTMLGPMIRHAICHEAGHALGLGHNMGGSWAYPSDSLCSVSFTREYGSCASVMDYARYNHLATASDVEAGVNLLPPRLGPYDYYAIALGYGTEGKAVPGPYCYFAPFIVAAVSPDPSAQPETLGNDLLRSSKAGIDNCRALLTLDGLDSRRKELLSRQYYRYIMLAMSNIGGAVKGEPVKMKEQRRTLEFIIGSLATVPPELADPVRRDRALDELSGNFLPARILETRGRCALNAYNRQLSGLLRKYDKQLYTY